MPDRRLDVLRPMAPLRQIEAAELMVGQNNFSGLFAKALLAATPEKLLVAARKKRSVNAPVTVEQIARMKRELASLQTQVKSMEDSYGVNNLYLTVAKGYVRTLLDNDRVARWLSQHRQEYLTEFQLIAEIEHIGIHQVAAE